MVSRLPIGSTGPIGSQICISVRPSELIVNMEYARARNARVGRRPGDVKDSMLPLCQEVQNSTRSSVARASQARL